MAKSRITIGDIVSVAKMEGLEICIVGHERTFERFAEKVVEMIGDELTEAQKALRAEIENWELWALIKVSGKDVFILGSWTRQPDWLMLADVKDLQSTYSIAHVRRLAESLEFKVDQWTSYKLIRLERPDDSSVAK